MDNYSLLSVMKDIFSVLGFLYIGKVFLTTLCDLAVGLRAHVYSKLRSKNYVEQYGKWAVVTGCTDGIGKAYLEELAKAGLNVILISRNMDKLNKVAAEIVSKYNVETEVVQVDFSDGRSVYEKVSKAFKNKEIGMLINNVGVMLPYPKYYSNVTEEEIWGHINVNMGSVLAMTKLVLPDMVSRGKGAIVNIASIAGSAPIPMMGIYSASKVFVDYFSQALEWEYSGKGITVQTVNPSYVATNMTSFSPWIGTESIVTPPPSTFASNAVSTIGYTKRTTGYWVHGVQAWFVDKVMSTWSFKYSMGNVQMFLVKDLKKKSP